MTREEKDIAKGYMSGKFLKQETKKELIFLLQKINLIVI